MSKRIPAAPRPALRPMTSADVPAVARIDGRAFGDDRWSAQAFRNELRRNRLARYFVLDPGDGGALPGYVGCWTLPGEVQIVTLAVDPAAQRQGLGELLLLRALALARESGAERVSLECRASNAPALALYRKYGFGTVGQRERYYHSGEETALILVAAEVNGARYGALLERRGAAHRRRHGGAPPPPTDRASPGRRGDAPILPAPWTAPR